MAGTFLPPRNKPFFRRKEGRGSLIYVYCLFCLTQRCKVIAKLMEIRGAARAFSPQIIRKQRKQGENIKKTFDLLPGYVFVYSESRLSDNRFFFGTDGVIRRVGRTDTGYELAGPDLDFAMKLLEKDGTVGSVKACHAGDQVILEDPLFSGCEGKVTEIDYRKERARVSFVFDNTKREIWVSLDGISQLSGPEGELLQNAITERI